MDFIALKHEFTPVKCKRISYWRGATSIVALTTAYMIATPGFAQQTGDETVVLPTITVSTDGQTAQPYAGGQVTATSSVGVLGTKEIMDTPFSTVSYTKAFIQDSGAQDVSSVIAKNDPAVQVSKKLNIFETYYIRGFPTTATDMTFNGLVGMAPNMRSSVEFADRVEVLKGPSTLLTGMLPSGSVGGVVNIVPKRAQDDDITQVTTTFESDSQFGIHGDIGRRFGTNKEFGIRINGVTRNGDTGVENERHKMNAGSVALDYRGERLRVTADYYKQKEDLDGVNYFGLSVADAVTQLPDARNGKHSLAAPWTFNTNDTRTFVLGAEYDLGTNVTAYAKLGWSKGGYDALITRNTLLNNAGDMSLMGVRQKTDDRRFSGEVGIRGNFETGSVTHNWSLSGTHFEGKQKFKYVYYNNLSPTNYNDLNFGPAPNTAGFDNLDMMAQINTTLTSYALVDTMGFNNDRLLVTLGARYQRVQNKQFYLANGYVASDYDAHRISPAIAALYKISDNVSVYANYIEGLSQGGIAPATADNPYSVMAPYKTTQYEAGVKWDLGTLATTLSVFQIEKPSAYTDPNTNIYGVYGQQRNRGVELSVFGEPQQGLRLMGGLAYTDAKITNAANRNNEGNQSAGVPSISAKVGVEYDVAAVAGLTVGGTVNFTGKRYISDNNVLSIPSYTTVDLAVRYTHDAYGAPLVIRAGIENVTNEKYWEFDSMSGGFGNPRTFAVSITKNF